MSMSMEPGADAVSAILPWPKSPRLIPRATKFRSTWITSSLEGLEKMGHLERYHERLTSFRSEILDCVAGSWLPMEAARAHYEACEALGLTDTQYLDVVRVGSEVRRAWYASLISAAERDTATPWSVLPMLRRVWHRTADGGEVAIFKLSEQQARVEYVGCELFDIPYFRRAVRLMVHSLTGHTRRKRSVKNLPAPASGSRYLVQWQ